MNVPAAVDAALDGESVAARVALRGEDALFVTATRTLAYRADGLLSDESVTPYDHDAERVAVSEGRRKAKITLDYGLDGEATLTVPASKLDDALHPILAGVLNHADVTDAGETVKRTYRFSELTLIVTSGRLVKHVGAAVWDDEYEEIHFDTVTDIDVEEGNVASQLVLETTGRTQRIKAPNDAFRDVRETVEDALYAAHDAASYEEFRRAVASETPEEDAASDVAFDNENLAPLGGRDDAERDDAEPTSETARESAPESASPSEEVSAATESVEPTGSAETTESAEVAESTESVESTGSAAARHADADSPESAVAAAALRDELDDLAATVDRQQSLIEDQAALIEEQRALIEDQRDRIDALRDAIPDR